MPYARPIFDVSRQRAHTVTRFFGGYAATLAVSESQGITYFLSGMDMIDEKVPLAFFLPKPSDRPREATDVNYVIYLLLDRSLHDVNVLVISCDLTRVCTCHSVNPNRLSVRCSLITINKYILL